MPRSFAIRAIPACWRVPAHALFAANPQAFMQYDPSRLKVGATLTLSRQPPAVRHRIRQRRQPLRQARP
ncbi:MAG: hypothetical protein VB142_01075 [Burkholderia sp.]